MKDNRFDEREPYVPISEDMADNDLLEEYEAQLAEKKAKQRGEAAPVQPAEPFVRQEAEVPAPPVPPVPERDEPKPPIYKQWWFWLIIGVVIIGIIVGIVVGVSKKDDTETTKATSTTASTTAESTTESTTATSSTTKEQTTQAQSTTAGTTAGTTESEDDKESRFNYALEKARSLSDLMHLSKQGIYNELVSPGGEKLKADAAQYAIDHLKTNYKANALTKAQEYSMDGLDEDEVYNKLVNEDLFTESEADYAVSHM